MARLNRRRFLRAASGLLVPAWFGITRADIVVPATRLPISSAVTIPTPTCFWTLNESSAGTSAVTRNDSVGGQNLTDASPYAASTTGVISNAVQLVAANTEYLSHADSATLQIGAQDATIAAWFWMDSKSANMTLVSKYDTAGNNRGYVIQYTQSVDRIRFIVSPDGTSTGLGIVAADNLGSPSTGQWYLAFVWHTNGVNIGIQIMGAAENTTAYTTGIYPSTATFYLGMDSGLSVKWDGRIDEVGLWKGVVLNAAQRNYIYNSGAGRASPYW